MSIMSDLLERDYHVNEKITEDMLESAYEQSSRVRGSVRMMVGRMYTEDDIEARFRRAWVRGPLPR